MVLGWRLLRPTTTSQLTTLRCCQGLLRLREGADVVYEVPGVFSFGAITLGRHFSFALLDNVEPLAVAAGLLNCGVGEVGDALHFGHIALAIAVLAMTDGAIVAINLLASGQRLRAGLDGIAPIGRFGGDLVLGVRRF